MRIGILSFGEGGMGEGSEPTTPAALADALRARDVDVITNDAPITTLAHAADEGARLQRADCDGVLLLVSGTKDASGATIVPLPAQAALLLGCPILLVGSFSGVFLDAAGALAEVGIPFKRQTMPDDIGYSQNGRHLPPYVELILNWAQANNKQERQRGQEAARKLYGQRLALPTGTVANLDPVLWRRQFGITVVPAGQDADFSAPDSDANAALTRHLLQLLTGAEAVVHTVEADGLAEADEGDVHTFAQIARRAGRYVCVIGRGATFIEPTESGAGYVSFGLLGWITEKLMASRLQAVSGEHIAALKAACESLDIEPVLFQDLQDV